MTVAFLACAEAGYLEAQAVLLARSIRAHGGDLRDAEVHVFSPRAGHGVGASTAAALRALHVHLHDGDLNVAYRDQPILNKVVVSAWAERNLDADVLVFVDSDTVFVDEPWHLALDSAPLAVRPVDSKNVGSTGPDDPHDAYWQAVYAACGVTEQRFTTTTVGGMRIREYFNAGLVAARVSTGFFTEWLRCLDLLVGASLRPPDGRWTFVDQVALAAAASRQHELLVLPPTYNYPLPKRPLLPPPWDVVPLDDLVHVHYHRWFARPGFLRELRPDVREGRTTRWLEPLLPLEPVHHEPMRFNRP